jgi:hypothetical protein
MRKTYLGAENSGFLKAGGRSYLPISGSEERVAGADGGGRLRLGYRVGDAWIPRKDSSSTADGEERVADLEHRGV